MDIFRFELDPLGPTPTKMENGKLINNIDTKLWVERYRGTGEFTLTGPAKSGLKNDLPIGSYISHVDTDEIMFVENHEINDEVGKEAILTITGSGLDSYTRHRIVGSNVTLPYVGPVGDYQLTAAYSWEHVRVLIEQHLLEVGLVDDSNAFLNLQVIDGVIGIFSEAEAPEARSFRVGADLYSAIQDLLEIDDIGLKVVRPGKPWNLIEASRPDTKLILHRGVDRTKEIVFSYDTGEVQTADYFWSNKEHKNVAFVSSKWVQLLVDDGTGPLLEKRRVMFVDASDIDDSFTEAPTGTDLSTIMDFMQQRGRLLLAKQKEIALTKAEVAKDAVKATYRKDFNIGDIITVIGDFNATSRMRVSEYVEIEDESGTTAYPTLSLAPSLGV